MSVSGRLQIPVSRSASGISCIIRIRLKNGCASLDLCGGSGLGNCIRVMGKSAQV